MYFITQPKPNTTIIGIYDNYIYAYGIESIKLVIYRKCIFDSGEWDTFFKPKQIIVPPITFQLLPEWPLLEIGSKLKFASGIIGSKIWIVGEMLIHLSIMINCAAACYDCNTKEFEIYPIILTEILLNFCDNNRYRKVDFFVVASHSSTESEERILLIPNTKIESLNFITFEIKIDKSQKIGKISVKHEFQNIPVGKVGYGNDGFATWYLKEKRIKIMSQWPSQWGDQRYNFRLKPTNKDITFCNSGEKLLTIITRQMDDQDDAKLQLYVVETKGCQTLNASYETINVIANTYHSSFFVDKNFPTFGTSQIFMAPNVLIFLTSDGIVTVLNRMLTLSESAYLSLCQNFPSKPNMQISKNAKEGCFGWFWDAISRPKQPKKMSLKHIQQILGLPKPLQLCHR